MATGILVNYNGCPQSLDALIPDNGLATLAGGLLSKGHKVKILDYCTIETISRMVPEELSSKLKSIYPDLLSILASGSSNLGIFSLIRIGMLKREIEKFRKKVLKEITEEITNSAKTLKVDFIGFKLWTGEGFDGSVEIAKNIKRVLPNIKIFAGGTHVDWFMESIFDYTDIFSVLAYGEGEETIILLAEYSQNKRNLSEIPNIIYREYGKNIINPMRRIDNLDLLPRPEYEKTVYPAMNGDQKLRIIMIDESRGCPNSCYFCSETRKSGNRWRERNATTIVDSIEEFIRNHHVTNYRFAGSNTPPNLRRKLAEEIIKRGLKINYAGFGHVRSANSEDYELLRSSGCLSLAFGIESGSQEIIDRDINKKVTIEEIKIALKKCKAANILIVASLIVPCPHDTKETIEETLKLITEIHPDAVTLQLPGLIPHTFWEENKEQFGFEPDRDYLKKIMVYKINFLLPPNLWPPLPYKVTGRSHKEIAKIAMEFFMQLEKQGVGVGISDYLLIIGKVLGKSVAEMREFNQKAFFMGDHQAIFDLTKQFNSKTVLLKE